MGRRVRIAIGVGAIVVVALVVYLTRGDGAAGGGGGGGSGSGRTGTMRGSAMRDIHAPEWFGVPSAADRRITGTVYLDGKPTAATLALASVATDAGVAQLVDGAATADGTFDLGVHRAGTYRLFAAAPGAVPRVVPVDCETRDANVEVFLDACRTTVQGDVRDASGGPIAGATISTGGFTLATTDPTGRYLLCLGTGGATLVARADGYSASGRRVRETGSIELDFDLIPDAVAIVHVVDANKVPVAGALVRAELPDDRDGARADDGAQPALGVTDAGGMIELRGLAPSTYAVTATADGLVSQAPVAIDPIAGQSIEVTLELVAAVGISGRLTEDDKPVVGFRLRWIVDELERARVVTGDDGTFAIADVPPGPGEFAVDSPAYLLEREFTAAAGAPPIELKVVRPHVVRGVVVRGASPIGGATVRFLEFGNDPAISRADGTFELAYGMSGDLTIEAQSDVLGAFGTTKIHVEDGADLDGVIVDVEFGGTIHGIVVDQAGTPLPGTSVRYDCDPLNDFGAGITRLDGTFTADKLRGGGAYRPTVELEGGVLEAASGEWPAIDVPPNGKVTGVRMVARVNRITVGGVVVDSGGAPAADVLIQMWPGPRETRSAVDGAFTLTSTSKGPFTLSARASGSRTARAERVVAGIRDVRLTLRDPGGVHITCGPEVGTVRLIGEGRGWKQRSIPCGATIKPVPPGHYMVMGEDIAAKVEVVGGRIAEIEVAPSGRSPVTIKLTGTPSAHVTCSSWWITDFVSTTFTISESGLEATGDTLTIDVQRGKNRIECNGDGTTGNKVIEVGDQPMQITVELRPL